MDGGRWILHAGKEPKLNNWWKKLITVMVEEQTRLVNGVLVSEREKGDKIAVIINHLLVTINQCHVI